MQTLIETVKQFGQSKQHALVIGDVMLDRYLMGEVGRISPEAPVPVVLIKSAEARAGGASNVAANLALLGINTHLVGCVGADEEAKILSQLVKACGVKANLITSKEETLGFGYGVDILECGICKLFKRYQYERFTPLLCEVDHITSSLAGLTLKRTGTIALGAQKCDFRFERKA